jgi:hypothetical protein
VGPTETLSLTVDGPFKPVHVALDGDTIEIDLGVPRPFTPKMLGGSGAHHEVDIILLFPAPGTPHHGYEILASDATADIDKFTRNQPDEAGMAKIEILVRVA